MNIIVAPKGFIVLTAVDTDTNETTQALVPVNKIATAVENQSTHPSVKSIVMLDVRNAVPVFVEETLQLIALLIGKAR